MFPNLFRRLKWRASPGRAQAGEERQGEAKRAYEQAIERQRQEQEGLREQVAALKQQLLVLADREARQRRAKLRWTLGSLVFGLLTGGLVGSHLCHLPEPKTQAPSLGPVPSHSPQNLLATPGPACEPTVECNDGTMSCSFGSGTCSDHGGIKPASKHRAEQKGSATGTAQPPGDIRVRGYYRKDGRYVHSYTRKRPNPTSEK